MLTFNQLQEKKTKIKINPKVQDQYEEKKHGANCDCKICEAKREQAEPDVQKNESVEFAEGYGKKKKHNCASKVKHEEYGVGDCISGMHNLDENGNVTHYDVEFEEYIVENCPVEELEIVQEGIHEHVIRDEESIEEERAARKMNVRTKGTIKKQIAKDAAAEAKRREKKTGEYAEKPKRKPRLKKPSQLTKVTGASKPEPKKEAPKPKAKPAAKKAAPKPKAKPVAAVKKVTPKAAPKKAAPKAKAKPAPKPAPKKAAPKPVAKKAAPKKEAPKKSSSLSDKARDWVKKGVKRHRKATQGARVFGKGFVKGAKDTVKFAGKVKKAVVGEELMSFKAYVNLNEDYYRGTGEKVQARTKKWMEKKGEKGAPGLDAMKARTAEHKAKRGVKSEGYQRDPERLKKDKTRSKQPDPSKDGFTGIGNMSIADIKKMNARMKKEEVENLDELKSTTLLSYSNKAANELAFKGDGSKKAQKRATGVKRAAGKLTMKAINKEEVEVVDEATRLKKEKGYDKGGTKKPSGKKDAALSAVLAKIRAEHGKGAVMGQGSRQSKKVRGAKDSREGKYLKRVKAKKELAGKAKKAGFKDTKGYIETMARYGGEDNYKKGRGLGT